MKFGMKSYFHTREISEISQSTNEDVDNQVPEMILHMKGPIYSTAERNLDSANSVMDQFSKRVYQSTSNPNKYFRQPVQIYPSLLLVNPSKSSKKL